MLPCQSRWSCVTFSTAAAVGSKSPGCIQLETRQLDHPDLRQRAAHRSSAASVSSSVGPMLPATATVLPAALDQLARQRRHRGLAVGAGHREHGGRISLLRASGPPARRRTGSTRRRPSSPRSRAAAETTGATCAGDRPGLRNTACTASSSSAASNAPAMNRACGTCSRSGLQLRRRLARVGHGHLRAAARAPARHRQARTRRGRG